MSKWTVVIQGDWYLPHLANMLKQYKGNSEQVECRDEVIAQIESQIITESVVTKKTRPLVVIDPEDTSNDNDISRLCGLIGKHHGSHGAVDVGLDWYSLQAALREFANPTPPKPAEPTGLGAVVEDAKGDLWANLRDDTVSEHDRTWMKVRNPAHWLDYRDINVVKVLSEGVS